MVAMWRPIKKKVTDFVLLQAVQEYSRQKCRTPSNPTENCCMLNLVKEESTRNLAEDEKTSITLLDYKCFNESFNEEDLILSFFQIALPSPQSSCNNSPSGSEEAVYITEEDLDGYDMCTDVSPSNGEFQSKASNGDAYPKPAIIKRLTCLFGALKVSASCEPPSSPVAEISAC
jgi:hypothetical protein